MFRSASALALFFWASVACGGGIGSLAHAETFQEALISAYQTNPRLKAERARVKEADENYIQARAQGRLTSNISSTIAGQAFRSPGQSFFGGGGERTIEGGYPRSNALQIIQPIYQGGRVDALKRQANSGILAARQTLRNAEQNLLVSAATAYVDVLRDEETAKIRRNNVSVLARQEQAARDRFDVGEGTLTDIAQSQSRLAAANIGLAQADAQLETSRAAYERAVGHPPVDLQPVPDFVLPVDVPRRQAMNAVERLSYEELDVENAIQQTISQIWAQLRAARRSVTASEQQVRAAEVAFEGVTLEQQVGTRDTLDVLNAEQELLNAKLSVINAERTVDATVYQLLSILGGFDADSIRLPVDIYDPQDNLDKVKNDGMSRAVDRFVPHAVKKIAPQIPDIPKDIIGVVTHNPIATEVKTFTNGLVDLGGTVGEAGKDYIDALTFQSNEVDRLKAEKLVPVEEIDVAPIIITEPNWIIPPTGVSPTIDSSGN